MLPLFLLNLPSHESAFFLNRRTVQFGPRKSETFVSDVFWRVGVFLVELFVEFDLLNENVILCVLAVCAFFNRGDTEWTNSSKILCSMFVYVLFYVNLCQD